MVINVCDYCFFGDLDDALRWLDIKYTCYVINVYKGNNKITNSEQSYKGKVKTHKYINRQNQSTTGKL